MARMQLQIEKGMRKKTSSLSENVRHYFLFFFVKLSSMLFCRCLSLLVANVLFSKPF